MIKGTTRAIVLAAGNSSRLKTDRSKLQEPICGQPMIMYVLKLLSSLEISTTVVAGKNLEELKALVENTKLKNIDFVLQEEPLGTAHAVACSQETWDKENILILNGDVPLLDSDIILQLCKSHVVGGFDLSFFSSDVLEPTGYGRVIEKDGKVRIVEEKDCTNEEKEAHLINAGAYIISKDFLEKNISQIHKSEKTKEYYITSLINMASESGNKLQYVFVPYDYVRGVNTFEELWVVEHIKRSQIIKHWMSEGVRFYEPQSVQIDIGVKIGIGSRIGAGAHLLGKTVVGEDCTIGSFSLLRDTVIDNKSIIHSHSAISDSVIGENCEVGPFARLRNNVAVDSNVIIGNFVEVKNSSLGAGAKAKHLSYLGDAELGSKVNIGAGTITCNHDGVNKHRTEINEGAYIGSNSTLVAPVRIGKNAYTAAGSTINKDVPENDLAIGRSRQDNKSGYAKRLRERALKKKREKNVVKKEEHPSKKLEFSFFGAIRTEDVSEETL